MPHPIETFVQPVRDTGAQTAIVTVLLLILLDFLTGFMGAIATRNFSSEKMRSGLLHKFTEMVAIALAIVLDGALTSNLGLSIEPVLIATCGYVGFMEVGSVLELIKKYNPDAAGLVGWLTSFVQPKGGIDREGDA